MLDKNVDIFIISETKLDDSFPLVQFKIEGFSNPYRYDRNDKGGGLLLHIREGIPSHLLQCKSQCNIESLSVEINLRKRKWFLITCAVLKEIQFQVTFQIKTYDNFIFKGDFNVGNDENYMKIFCDINCLKILIKVPTCFKNPDKPTLTLYLQIGPIYSNTAVLLKQASDFHRLTVTELKMAAQKLKPKIIAYRDYKNFDNAKFRYDIVTATSNVDNFGMEKSTIFNIFNRHVSIKKSTYIRANEAAFMSKD